MFHFLDFMDFVTTIFVWGCIIWLVCMIVGHAIGAIFYAVENPVIKVTPEEQSEIVAKIKKMYDDYNAHHGTNYRI
jgi:hypothetical protein